jgi:hypothetical protein
VDISLPNSPCSLVRFTPQVHKCRVIVGAFRTSNMTVGKPEVNWLRFGAGVLEPKCGNPASGLAKAFLCFWLRLRATPLGWKGHITQVQVLTPFHPLTLCA